MPGDIGPPQALLGLKQERTHDRGHDGAADIVASWETLREVWG